MKKKFRAWLKKIGWYEHIRYSILFNLYARFFKPEVSHNHQREVSFYKSFLPHCKLVFDIGAYDGHKTAAFLEMADKVICCEPDLQNFRTLQIRFRNYRKRVFIENKAVADHTGTATYYIHHDASAMNTLNPKWKQILENDKATRWNELIEFSRQTTVPLTTLDELIKKYGRPDFIKIDVEGYEEWVFRGLQEKIPYLSFECLLPDCETELYNCLGYLYQLDASVTFNAAYEETLLFNQFIPYKEMYEWIAQAPPRCFEVIAKMDL